MKSSNDAPLTPADKTPRSWTPPELGVDPAVASLDAQKQRALSFFTNENEKGTTGQGRSGKSSAVHAAGTNQHFSTWLPGITELESEPSEGSEWTFIKVSENGLIAEQERSARFFPSGGARRTGHSLPESEGKMILDRARKQAEEIMLAAQAEADEVLLQVQNEIEEHKKAAYQQGLQEARREMDYALKTVRAMLAEVDAWKNDLTSQGEKILVDMVKDISRKMFGEGLELDKNVLQSNLNRVLESAHGLGNLNIFLNPRDARMLDSSWVDQQILISGGQVKVIPSGNIASGGCYIKGNMGTVDGRVETQLDAILKTFDETDTLDE